MSLMTSIFLFFLKAHQIIVIPGVSVYRLVHVFGLIIFFKQDKDLVVKDATSVDQEV